MTVPLVVLGRVLGTCVGCGQSDDFSIVVADFKPIRGCSLPPSSHEGGLTIDYDSGTFSYYGDDGITTDIYDIAAVVLSMPRQLPLDAFKVTAEDMAEVEDDDE